MTKGFVKFLFFLFVVNLCASCLPSSIGSGDFRYTANKIKLKSTNELYRFLTYDEKRFPLISAHRGGPTDKFPENALETFENTFRKQPVIIECDIRLTNDSKLVLLHDETLDRTTTGSGNVQDYTLAALKKFQLKDPQGQMTPYRIPTLDEALQWGAGKVIFTLDVKRDVPYDLVIDAIRRNKAEAYTVVITYNADQAAAVHQLAPDLMISASIRSASDLLRLSDRNVPDNRLVAFVGTSEVDPGVYELLHGHGILCILGTIGNLDKRAATHGPSTYVELVERGADILATDYPVEAGRALNTYRGANKLTSAFID